MIRFPILCAVVCGVALGQGLVVDAQESSDSQQTIRFWESPHLSMDDVTLSQTKVRLVASPSRESRFATFEVASQRAPQDFKPTNPILAPFVSAEQTNYRVEQLSKGVMPFVDRKYRVTRLPDAFNGLPLLRTKMGHKSIVDSRFALVLEVSEPAYAFLAIDERAIDTYKESGTPAWIHEFAPTGLRIVTDDPIMKQTDSARAIDE